MKNRQAKLPQERRAPLPRGEAFLVGAVALLISAAILFFAVSTSRPSEPSRIRSNYEQPTELTPALGESRMYPTQLSQKEKIQ